MKFTPITGRLTFVGNSTAPATKDASRPNANWTYSSLIFREAETGEEITVPNCKVSGNLNRHIEPSEEGTFLIGRSGNERMLVGFRNERYETINEWVTNPQGRITLPLFLLFAGLVLSLLMIGIPIVIYAIYLFVKLNRLPGQLKTALEDNGFTVRAARTV